MINAADARKITDLYNTPKNPWDVLFTKIENVAKEGHAYCLFDEKTENAYFKENRKEVAEKLRNFGYSVEYRRVRDCDGYYSDHFHNLYTISW